MQVFLSQLTLGLVNGSFYAMLSLGLAVIFGLLGVVNFAHGAMYMLGAYVAWLGLDGVDLTVRAKLLVHHFEGQIDAIRWSPGGTASR